jgi:hypothetical protein
VRPSVVLLGFVLGTASSITFALSGVTVVFMLLQAEYPRLRAEFPALLLSLGLFAALTAAAGLSFYGQTQRSPWRAVAHGLLVAGAAGIAWYYWPD